MKHTNWNYEDGTPEDGPRTYSEPLDNGLVWWEKGKANGYTYSAKVYSKPSHFGINNGRISKLSIRDANGKQVANYDRGWDGRPATDEAKQALKIILSTYN